MGLAVVVAAAIFVFARPWWTPSVALVIAYVVTPVAKEVWIPLGHTQFGLPYAYVGALLLLVNAAFCLFALFALPIDRVPRVGRAVRRLGERVQSSALARRSIVAALAVAVAAPVHSGGAVAGSLAGRLLGLRTMQTFAAVMGAISVRTLVVVLAAYGVMGA